MKQTIKKLSVALGLLWFTFIVEADAQKLKNATEYLQKKSRVGILLQTSIDHREKLGSHGGLVSVAMSASSSKKASKYDAPLKFVEPQVDPRAKLVTLYTNVLSKKGKEVVALNLNIDSLKLKEFEKPKDKVKYFEQDLRFLKDKFALDEILVVVVDYGLKITYSYGMEIRRDGLCDIKSDMVDLATNSIIYKEFTHVTSHIHGDWDTPPQYENLKACIVEAVDEA